MTPGIELTLNDAGNQEKPSTDERVLVGQYLMLLHTLETHELMFFVCSLTLKKHLTLCHMES